MMSGKDQKDVPKEKKSLTKRNFPKERLKLLVARDSSLVNIVPTWDDPQQKRDYQRDSKPIIRKYEEALKKLDEEEMALKGHVTGR